MPPYTPLTPEQQAARAAAVQSLYPNVGQPSLAERMQAPPLSPAEIEAIKRKRLEEELARRRAAEAAARARQAQEEAAIRGAEQQQRTFRSGRTLGEMMQDNPWSPPQ